MDAKYFVIHADKFKDFRVRKVPDNAKLVIAFCLKDAEGWYAINIIQISRSEHNLIPMIRACKELNTPKNEKIFLK